MEKADKRKGVKYDQRRKGDKLNQGLQKLNCCEKTKENFWIRI